MVSHPTTLINAPRQVPHPELDDRGWGLFAALYGCRPADVFGPNVNDLARIGDGISAAGGGVVATLPILATYLTEPFEPSPYAPVSQRYWNELYLDISATPELAASERARRLLEDPATRQAAEELRTATHFDHRRRYALVRPVLGRAGGDVLLPLPHPTGPPSTPGRRLGPTPPATPPSGRRRIAPAPAGTVGDWVRDACPTTPPALVRRLPICGPSGRWTPSWPEWPLT